VGAIFLALLGIAAAVIRSVRLANEPTTGFGAETSVGFASHSVLTLIHIIPGTLFMILAPFQFSSRLRARAPRVHHWIGRTVIMLAMVIGITALSMSFQIAIGGINEIAATVLFDLLFLFCLLKGYFCALRRDFVHHREWMIRMFGIALGIGATRPVMGVFFATSRLTHLTPQQFFGTAFWIGFSVTLIAAESWINYTRSRLSASPVRVAKHA
jgi:hypothetical protein